MGRYIRYREHKHYSRYYTRSLLRQVRNISMAKIKVSRVPDLLKQTFGIEVVDPLSPDFPHRQQKKIMEPTEAFVVENNIESHPLYKPQACFTHDGSKPLADGVNHAAYLIKAVVKNVLPDSILEKAQKFPIDLSTKEHVFRLIMQSQQWDSALEKLPQRRDKVLWWRRYEAYYGIPLARKNHILIDNLFRKSLMMAKEFPEIHNVQSFRNGEINAVVNRLENPVRITTKPYLTVSHPNALAPFLPDVEISKTLAENLHSIDPIGPFIDLTPENLYDDTSFYPLMWDDKKSVPHTLFLGKDVNLRYPWTATENAANAVLATFGIASSYAMRKYAGASLKIAQVLPEPVTVQCVQVSGGIFDFITLQLNTLDLKNDAGVKNVVWVDKNNSMFSSPPYYEDFKEVKDFNPSVLQKFFALVLNGMGNKN